MDGFAVLLMAAALLYKLVGLSFMREVKVLEIFY